MASAFNLTAQINLRGPANLKSTVSNIRKQFASINTKIDLKIDPRAQKGIQSASKKMLDLSKAIRRANNDASLLNKTLASLSSGIKNTATSIGSADKTVSRLSKSTNKLRSDVKTTTDAFEEMGRQASISFKRFAGTAVITAGFYNLKGIIDDAADSFVELDKQMIRIQQVTGLNRIGIKALETEITNLSTSLGLQASELAKTSVKLAQAGLTAKQTQVALRALAKTELAPTFDNIDKTAEGAIAAMRQFKIQAKDLESVLGSINAVAGQFAVESGDIISAIQRTGGVFASASKGVSQGKKALQEFVAVFTSIRATTRESGEGIATGLRTILTRIQRSSTIEQLKQLGVELRNTKGEFIGAYAAVEALAKGLEGLNTRSEVFSKIVEELGGFRQIGKVIPLLSEFGIAQAALQAAQQGQTSLTKAQEKAQESLAVKLGKVRAEFQALFKEIGDSKTFSVLTTGALAFANTLLQIGRVIKGLAPVLAILGAIKGAKALINFGTGLFGGGARNKQGTNRSSIAERVGSRSAGSGSPSSGERQLSDALSKASDVTKANTSALQDLTTSVKSLEAQIKTSDASRPYGFARGGVVPGSGSGDTVPAMLTPGEFVIRKDAVKALGTEKLHKMNKYKNGGGILDVDTIGAAVLGNKNSNQSGTQGIQDPITVSYIVKQVGEDSKDAVAQVFADKPNKRYDLKKEIVAPEIRKKIDKGIEKASIQSLKILSDELKEEGLTSIGTSTNANKNNFIRSLNEGIRGNLFEQALTGIQNQGTWSDNPDPQAPFDFIGPFNDKLGKLFPQIKNIKYKDAKATLQGASKENMAKKIGNQAIRGANPSSILKGELQRIYNDLKEADGPLNWNRLFQGSRANPDTIKKQAQKFPTIFRFQKGQKNNDPIQVSLANKRVELAKGGYAKDTVPAMLTPGEFVINKQAAAKIGSAQLNRMNKADKVQGFNKGGPVGFVQRFAEGGDVFDILREESGKSAEGFTTQLKRELAALAVEITKGLKNAQKDFIIESSKAKQQLLAGGDKKEIKKSLKGSLSSVATSGGITDPAVVNKAIKDIMKGFKKGLSIPEIKASSSSLASILDAQVSDQDALNKSIKELSLSTGIAAEKLEGIASVKDVQSAKTIRGKIGNFFRDNIGSVIGGFALLTGAVTSATTAFKEYVPTTNSTVAGGLEAAERGSASALTYSVAGNAIAGATGGIVGAIGGAIVGGIEGAIKGYNTQKLSNSLDKLGQSAERLDKIFDSVTEKTSLEEFSLIQKNINQQFGQRLIETQKLDEAIQTTGPTGQDIAFGSTVTTAAATGGLLLGSAAAAKIGAALGTTIAPGVGTAIGAVVGVGAGLAYSYLNSPSSAFRQENMAARIDEAEVNVRNQERNNREVVLKAKTSEELNKLRKTLSEKSVPEAIEFSQTIKNYEASILEATPNVESLSAAQKKQILVTARERAAIDAYIVKRKQQGADQKRIQKELTENRDVAVQSGLKYVIENEKIVVSQVAVQKNAGFLAAAFADLSDKFNKVSSMAKSFSDSLSVVEKSLEIELDTISGQITDNISTFYDELINNLNNLEALSVDQYRQVANQATAGQGRAGAEVAQVAVVGKILNERLKPLIRSFTRTPSEERDTDVIEEGLTKLVRGVLPNIDQNLLDNVVKQFTTRLQQGETDVEQLTESFSALFPAAKDAEQALIALGQSQRNLAQTQARLVQKQNQLLIESNNLRRQEAKAISDSRINYLRTTGQSVPLEQTVGAFTEQIRMMTEGLVPGGSVDANQIGSAVRDRQERNSQLREINNTLLRNRNNDPNANAVISRNDNEIRRNEPLIQQGNEALKEIANNTEAASSVLEKIRAQQDRDKVATNYLDRIFGGTITDQVDLGLDLQTVLRGIDAAQRGDTSPFANPQFYKTFMGSEALGMFTKEQQSFLRTFARTAAAFETGGNQMARMAYEMSVRTEKGDVASPEAQMYKTLITNQQSALQQLSLQNQDALNKTTQSLESNLKMMIRQLPLLTAQAFQQVFNNTARGNGAGAPPLRRSSGGIVYASEGTFVNYEPRGTDTVPAMLTPGEFVVNANATKKNRALLESINKGNAIYASRGGVVYAANGGRVKNPYADYSDEDLEKAKEEADAKQWFHENHMGKARIPNMAAKYAWFTPNFGSMSKQQQQAIINKNIERFNRYQQGFEKILEEKGINPNDRDPNSRTQSVNLFRLEGNKAREERALIGAERLDRMYPDSPKPEQPSAQPPARPVVPPQQPATSPLTTPTSSTNRSRKPLNIFEARQRELRQREERKRARLDSRPAKMPTQPRNNFVEKLDGYRLGEWLYSEMVKDMTRDNYDMSSGSNPNGLMRYYEQFFKDKLGTSFTLIGNLNGSEQLYNWHNRGDSKLRTRAIAALESRIKSADELKLGTEKERIKNKIAEDAETADQKRDREKLLFEVYSAGHRWTDAQMIAKSKAMQKGMQVMNFGSTAGTTTVGHVVGLGDAPLESPSLEEITRLSRSPATRHTIDTSPTRQYGKALLSIRKAINESSPSMPGFLGDNQGFGGVVPVRLDQLDNATLEKLLKFYQQKTLDRERADEERQAEAEAKVEADRQFRELGSPSLDLPTLINGGGVLFKIARNLLTQQNPPQEAVEVPIRKRPGSVQAAEEDLRLNSLGIGTGSLTPTFGDMAQTQTKPGMTYQQLPDDILLAQGLPPELVSILQQTYSPDKGYAWSLRRTENAWQKGVDKKIHGPLQKSTNDLWESGNGLTSFFPWALDRAAGLLLDSPTYSPGYVGEYEDGTKLVVPSDSDMPIGLDIGIAAVLRKIAMASKARRAARAMDAAEEASLARGDELPFHPPAIKPDPLPIPKPEITPQTPASSVGIPDDLFSPGPLLSEYTNPVTGQRSYRGAGGRFVPGEQTPSAKVTPPTPEPGASGVTSRGERVTWTVDSKGRGVWRLNSKGSDIPGRGKAVPRDTVTPTEIDRATVANQPVSPSEPNRGFYRSNNNYQQGMASLIKRGLSPKIKLSAKEMDRLISEAKRYPKNSAQLESFLQDRINKYNDIFAQRMVGDPSVNVNSASTSTIPPESFTETPKPLVDFDRPIMDYGIFPQTQTRSPSKVSTPVAKPIEPVQTGNSSFDFSLGEPLPTNLPAPSGQAINRRKLQMQMDSGTVDTNPNSPGYVTGFTDVLQPKPSKFLQSFIDTMTKERQSTPRMIGQGTRKAFDFVKEALSNPNVRIGSAFALWELLGAWQFNKQAEQQAAEDKELEKKIRNKSRGGIVYASQGTLVPYQPKGTDTVPAMLTPGEFVVNRRATQRNLPLLKSINSGTSYLNAGGQPGGGSTSSNNGIAAIFDFTKFNQGVDSFNAATKSFSDTISNFNTYVTRLEKLNIPSIPDKIEMFGTHRVELNVTGSAAFEALEVGVQRMINTKIAEKWNELWQQSDGKLGSPQR